MHSIVARNPAEGIRIAVNRLVSQQNVVETDKGPAYVFDAPLILMFTHPKECFVSDPAKDDNPFTALIEAMWLVSGRSNRIFLDHIIRTGGERLKSHFGFDQLITVLGKLRSDPGTDHAVLQLWSPGDLTTTVKDQLFHTEVTFKIRRGCLDMMVTDCSNDIWNGMFGNDTTKFSILQRVVADKLGISVGKYWAMSNNARFYLSDSQTLLAKGSLSKSLYPQKTYRRVVNNIVTWDAELDQFMKKLDALNHEEDMQQTSFKNGFLNEVFRACTAYKMYRTGNTGDALAVADLIGDGSWKEFCVAWLRRRTENG
jgi:hypothetical protein